MSSLKKDCRFLRLDIEIGSSGKERYTNKCSRPEEPYSLNKEPDCDGCDYYRKDYDPRDLFVALHQVLGALRACKYESTTDILNPICDVVESHCPSCELETFCGSRETRCTEELMPSEVVELNQWVLVEIDRLEKYLR